MAKETLTLEIAVPDGFELTGEYRIPAEGEYYTAGIGEKPGFFVAHHDLVYPRPILRRVAPAPAPGQVWRSHNTGTLYMVVGRSNSAKLYSVSLDSCWRNGIFYTIPPDFRHHHTYVPGPVTVVVP